MADGDGCPRLPMLGDVGAPAALRRHASPNDQVAELDPPVLGGDALGSALASDADDCDFA